MPAHRGWPKAFKAVNDMNSGQELSLFEIQVYFKSKPERVNPQPVAICINFTQWGFFFKDTDFSPNIHSTS